MKFTTAIALLISASSALAAPLEARHNVAKPFTLEVTFSNSPLKGPIQASGGSFWIGKQASTSCPTSVGKNCPPGNSTSFVSSNDGRLSLNTEVPGGQQVYIAPNGLLTYTVPHSGNMPAGSTTTGFEIAPDNLFSKYYEFWLCAENANDKAYRIWLKYRDSQGSIKQNGQNDKGACSMVNLVAKDVASKSPAAWEYN